MLNGKKELKFYHGVIAFLLFLISLLVIRSPVGRVFGSYVSLVGELLFLLTAVGTVVIFRGNLREAFPVGKPKIVPLVGGGILLWAMNTVSTACLMIAMYLAPKQIQDATQQLGGMDLGMGFLLSAFIIAVMPAICEEAVFRGVLQSSLKGSISNKWMVIVVIGVLFGACHGSAVKFLSTGLIGAVFAYIVYETGNMVYTVILHFLNNFIAVVILYIMTKFLNLVSSSGVYDSAADPVSVAGIPLMTVAIYVLAAAAVPFAVYIGNYLLHRGIRRDADRIYTKEKKTTMIVLLIITGTILLCGLILLCTSFIVDVSYMNEMVQYQYNFKY